MNQTDRDRLAALLSCINGIPWPNRNRTLGPNDLSDFLRNMEDIVPRIKDCIMAIARCDSELEDPDQELADLQQALRGKKRGEK